MSYTVGPLVISRTPDGLHVAGEIDASTVEAFSSDLLSMLATRDVAVNMSEIQFIDSSGLRVLIEAHSNALEQRRQFVIDSPSPIVKRLLEVTGLSDLFTIVPVH